VLEAAIIKALKRSSHSHVVPKLFPKKKQSMQYQFMGFVASHIKGGDVLAGFHPSSFVIFKTDIQNKKHSSGLCTYLLTSYFIKYARPIVAVDPNLSIPPL
jgi:hypothetical protein